MRSSSRNQPLSWRARGHGSACYLPRASIRVSSASAARALEVDWSEFRAALLNLDHRSRRSFFGVSDGYWFPNWFSLVSHVLSDEEGRK